MNLGLIKRWMIAPAATAVLGFAVASQAQAGWGHYGHRGHHGHHGHHGHRSHFGHHSFRGHHGHHRGHYGSRYYGGHGLSYRSYGSRYRYSPRYYSRSYGGRYYPGYYNSRSYSYRPSYSGGSYGHRGSSYSGDSSRRYGGGYDAGDTAPSYSGGDAPGFAGRPWSLLAEGNAAAARTAFARLAESRPTAGEPKLGYALATAMQEDHDEAVWAMRRAVRFGGAELASLQPSGELAAEIDSLAQRYSGEGEAYLPAADASFLTASLRYVTGQTEAAKQACLKAMEQGDRSESTLALRGLIDQQTTTAEATSPGGEPAERQRPRAAFETGPPQFDSPDQSSSPSDALEPPPPPKPGLPPNTAGLDIPRS